MPGFQLPQTGNELASLCLSLVLGKMEQLIAKLLFCLLGRYCSWTLGSSLFQSDSFKKVYPTQFSLTLNTSENGLLKKTNKKNSSTHEPAASLSSCLFPNMKNVDYILLWLYKCSSENNYTCHRWNLEIS